MLEQVKQAGAYRTVRECHQEKGYPVAELCRLLHIAKLAYYKWEAGKKGNRIRENEDIADKVEKIHEKSPDKGNAYFSLSTPASLTRTRLASFAIAYRAERKLM